jgi:hypothetical protein
MPSFAALMINASRAEREVMGKMYELSIGSNLQLPRMGDAVICTVISVSALHSDMGKAPAGLRKRSGLLLP